MTKRPLFTNRFATIITMIGVSVGLGNVWRFPYMMGEYGGSAFLFIYLIFTLLFAVPAVMVEWGLGRSTRSAPVGAFTKMWGSRAGYIVGFMLLFTVLIAESYYLYVISNITYAFLFNVQHGFSAENIPQFKHNLNDPMIQYGITLILLLLSYIVLHKGLKKGIESISKIFVPFFVMVMIFLIVFALNMEHAGQYLKAFLSPDFSALKPIHIFAALGQAFFSLGLGGTFLLVFGSYIRKEENLVKSSFFMAVGDISTALLAGLFIVPTVLALGLNMNEGPGLLFNTLPELFQRLPFGRIAGSFFLMSLLMVTFISSIAALQVLLSGLTEVFGAKITRQRLIIVILILVGVIILPIALHPDVIGILDLIFGSGMQVLGSLLALLAFSWGQCKIDAIKAIFGEVTNSTTDSVVAPWHDYFYFWVKWCVPFVLIVVLVGYIISKL